jgi:hypothetical protein
MSSNNWMAALAALAIITLRLQLPQGRHLEGALDGAPRDRPYGLNRRSALAA